MKNIIKRGTSLLLVLAMLLSFAAVVGAADERLPVEGEKPVTLSLDSVVLRQGSTDVQYVPVRLTIEPGFAITGFQLAAVSSDESAVEVTGFYPKRPLKIYEDGSVNYDETIGTIFGKLYSNYGSSESKDPVQKFACANGKGVTSETISTRAEDGVIKEPDLAGYIGVKVKDGAQSGAYQLSIIPNASRDRDTTKRNDIVFTIGTQNTYTDAYATLNAGTAIVLPEGASETVFLTQDTFAAPTWENRVSGGVYDLADYLKIAKAGIDGSVSIYPVDKNGLSITGSAPKGATLENNVLAVGTGVTNGDGAELTVVAAPGGGISLSAPVTVKVKVSKEAPYRKYIGFGKNATYSPVPTTTQTIEAEAYDVSEQSSYYALDAGNPATFDQYGVEMSQKAKLEVALYTDDTFEIRLANGDDAWNRVKAGETKLQISNQLKKDVWCMVKTYVEAESTDAKTYGEQAKVHIVSQYPQAEKAVIKLTDGSGNPFSGDAAKGTFDIPGGSGRTTIKFAVDKFLDKKGGEMTSATAPTGYTVSAVNPSIAGVTVDNTNKTIDVTSEAVKSAPVEIEIKVTLADNTELTGILKVGTKELPAKITLKKGNSFATSLASYDSNSYAKGVIRADSHEGNALPTVLPGIRSTDSASVVLAPLYVLDQYDAVMQTGVAAANYKLYKVDGETKTPISADYAKFEDGIEGRVTLKLTNALVGEEGAKSLALTEDEYQIEATYNNKTATARFTMAEAAEKTYVATVTAEITTNGYTGDTSVKTLPVQYAHGGTSQQRQTPEITYTATVTDQYGKTPAEGTNVVAAITSIKLDTKQAEYINDTQKFYVTNGPANAAKLQVTKELATVMNLDAADSVVVHVGLTVTVGGKPATVESVPDYTFTTDEPKLGSLGVYLRTDESVLTALGSWSSNDTNNPEALTIVAPAGDGTTRNVLDFAVYDQYRRSNGFAKALTKGWLVKGELPTGMTFGDKSLTAGSIYEVTVTKDAVGKMFTITAPAAKNVGGTDWTVKVTAVAVEFVNGAGEPYTIGKLLDTAKLSKVYNRDTWHQVIEGASAVTGPNDKNSKVYIRGAEGQNNVEVTQKIWAEVIDKTTGQTVYDARDSLANPAGPTASATEKAGTYIVKIFYREKEGDAPIEVCSSGEFTISPKPITIELKDVSQTITKPYDGNTNLPGGLELGPKDTVENDRVNLIPGNLEFAQADVKLNGDGTVDSIPIRVKAGMDCLSGDDAGNYTVELEDGNIKGLTGTINKRTIVVTPKSSDEVNLTYGDDVAEKLASEYTTNIDALPTTCVKPTIEGSMALTTGETEASAPYDAGEYTVALGNLSLTGTSAGNYQLGLASGTHTWTINRKLLTKVKNSGLPQSAFGVNTDQGCISHLLRMFAKDADGSLIEGLRVSDFVDASALSFPSDTVYVTGQGGKQYPVPGTYTLTVTNKPKKDIGKNYRVDDTTEYEFDYTVNKLDARDLTVRLTKADGTAYTEDTYTYNGTEQGPTVSVTYKNQANDTLDLTSLSSTHGTGTTKATDAGTYTITVTSDLVNGSKTVTWKINQKTITKDMFSQKEPHPVYDGTAQTLTGNVLDGKDSGITVNGENKVLQPGADFTAAEVKQTNAGEYTMTVTGQGNYTGTADVKVKIDKFVATGENLLLSMSISSNQVTRGKTTTLYIDTAVLLKSDELEQFNGQKEGKVTWVVGKNTPNATINVEALENQKKLKVTVTVPNDATPDKEHAQIAITLQTAFNVDGGTHQNIESGQVRTYQLYVTDKEQQENFKIDQGESGTYSYSQGSLQLTASGSATGSTVTWSSSDTSVATVDNGKVTFVKPGDATITATASETDDYAATSDTYTLTITKGQVTVSASSATMTANDPLPGFSATASGLNPNDSVSEVFQTLTASAATDGKTAGTFRVTPNATFKTGGRKNWSECYDLYFVAGTLTVNPAVSVIDTVLPTIIAGNGCANGYANCACESFYDLDASRWYHEAIDWAYSLGLMNGTTKSTFGPNAAATRAQTWTMLARIAGQDTRRSSTWYEVGQKWAMNLGITDGTNPMGSLTREQLAAMLYRYVGSPAVNGTLTFTDRANVSTWARNAMIWAVQNGILDGVGGNRLNPKGTTTRAQAAAIFMRFSKLINK